MLTKKYLFIIFLFFVFSGFSQEKKKNEDLKDDTDQYGPVKIKINELGTKYLRFIFYGQMQGIYNNIGEENSSFDYNIARAKIAAIGQFSPRFLLFIQAGTNNLKTKDNQSSQGKGYADLFFSDFVGEYRLFEQKLYLGTGIHYWGGISRQGRSAAIQFMTLTNPNPQAAWYQFGRTGLFGRDVGIYLKGNVNTKFQWTVSMNDAETNYAAGINPSQNPDLKTLSSTTSVYGGAQLLTKFNSYKARFYYTARVEYEFFDTEVDRLPFKKGGASDRKGHLLNIGAGVSYHPSAAILLKSDATVTNFQDLTALKSISEVKKNVVFEDAKHLALDVYYEKKGLSFYGLYQHTDYGSNANLYGWFTGNNFVFTTGMVLPYKGKTTYQPYLGYNILSPDLTDAKSGYQFKAGINLLHISHFMKTTFEYQNNRQWYQGNTKSDVVNSFLVQMQFVL